MVTNNKKGRGGKSGGVGRPAKSATAAAVKKQSAAVVADKSSRNKDNKQQQQSLSAKLAAPAAAAAAATTTTSDVVNNVSSSHLPTPVYLVSCDIPTKQYIQYLNEQMGGGNTNSNKKFILQDLDATHCIIKGSARHEIDAKLEAWFDLNIFSAIEKVGEDFDMS